jgi:hypothetical protein
MKTDRVNRDTENRIAFPSLHHRSLIALSSNHHRMKRLAYTMIEVLP